MRKTIISVAMAAAIFTGCEGVDSQKLAELTGDKSFEQVKESYKTAVFYDKKEDLEIYKYYLKKNQDNVPGFDFESFSIKTDSDYVKLKKELDDKLQNLRNNLHKITITQLQNEMTMYAFATGRAKAIDNYVKALQQLQKDKWEMIAAAKKAEKQAQREKFEAAKARSEVGTVEKIDVFKAQK